MRGGFSFIEHLLSNSEPQKGPLRVQITHAKLDLWFPEEAVQKGPYKGSMRKQFITKLVCKKKDGAYTVLQQFAWDFYRDLRAEPEWSRFELFSDKKNNKKKGDECLK